MGIAAVISSCENPGSVGSGLSESGADVEILRDTIGVVDTLGFNSYSGNYAFFAAGAYNDPLFGELKATGLVRPSLPAAGDSLEEDATMKMRILFDSQNVYGDTLADQSFEVYRIEEYWRSRTHKLKDELQIDQSQAVASFTVETEDSMDVTLDPAWVSEYYMAYAESEDADADSLYQNEVYGLALVPSGSNKIIPLDAQSTRFVIENPETDTFEVSNGQWAYHMSRSNEPDQPEGSAAAYNMLENILSFRLDLSGIDINGPSISRAELVFYQDNAIMEQSISGSVKRPQPQSAQLRFVNSGQIPDNLIAGNPSANGSYSEEDHAFHFNVTSLIQNGLINGFPENRKFYFMLSNDGSVKASLLSIDPGSEKAPKLVITYLKNSTE
ncbi:hypothetical protein [Fodinibius sp.]|uniref:hypothetical protein n=1 Tax=Fodinibius sp. TaxID=1872440 RepID=UPI003567D108